MGDGLRGLKKNKSVFFPQLTSHFAMDEHHHRTSGGPKHHLIYVIAETGRSSKQTMTSSCHPSLLPLRTCAPRISRLPILAGSPSRLVVFNKPPSCICASLLERAAQANSNILELTVKSNRSIVPICWLLRGGSLDAVQPPSARSSSPDASFRWDHIGAR